MRFIPAGYFDLASLYSSYIGKHKKGLLDISNPIYHNVRSLELLVDKEETEVTKGWSSAKSLHNKVNGMLESIANPAEIINSYILAFSPDAYTDWESEDHIDPDHFGRIMCLLNPSPNFRVYSGEEMASPAPWGGLVVEHRGLVSMSNFNAPNTAHVLVLETLAKG